MMDVSDPSKPGKPERVWNPESVTTDSEETLSLEEKLRRERSRTMSVGITQYFWPSVSSRILIPLSGSLYCKEASMFGDETAIRKVFDKDEEPADPNDDAKGGALDPTLSPDGKFVAFVRDNELYVLALEEADAKPVRITKDARGTGRTNGLADYLAQEEMDRYAGFWWSQDSSMIAFEQVDESHIPEYRIMHQGSDLVGDQAQEDHRYPFAGGPNPHVKLGIVKIAPVLAGEEAQVGWLDTETVAGQPADNYLGRVNWLPDGTLSAQLENREQTELVLVQYDPDTLERTDLLHEKSDIWINLHNLFLPFQVVAGTTTPGPNGETISGSYFIWGSERTGFMHLYLYSYDPETKEVALVKTLTEGDWLVTGLAQLSVKNGRVYYHATKKDATQRQLYYSDLWTDEAPKAVDVTTKKGTNHVVIDSGCSMAVVSHSSISEPPTALFCSLESDTLTTVEELFDAKTSPLTREQLEELAPAFENLEIIRFPSTDGEVELIGALQLPDPEIYGPGPYPLIVPVYGGPHVQRVMDVWWTPADMRSTRFASEGFAMLKVDNRGSFYRGLAFEGAVKNCMGTVEVEDQVAGVQHLVSSGLVDPKRVGINGWSYGGYMSLMCLFQRPDVFNVAISGAPVTNWDGYDSHYTERYMGTPASNPKGYHDGSVMTHVPTFSKDSHLMLIHGLIDENVHFRHTARLVNALIAARKKYDLLLFPDERHSPRKLGDRIYIEQRILEYFVEHLKP